MIRTARFLGTYLRDRTPPGVREEEVTITVGGEAREATLFSPPGEGPGPAWVVLQGLTVHGRAHPAMRRFMRALSATGAVVLAPEVPAWSRLELDVSAARETLAAAVLHLHAMPRVTGVGAVGFSFGATQAVMAAADPRLRGRLDVVLGFGGYCDLGRMLRCLFTGEHEWEGVRYRLDPDPYGRWVVVGSFLTLIPGFEGMEAVQRAARTLAEETGRTLTWAWEPAVDARKAELRETLPPDQRRVWDVVAPLTGAPVDEAAAREMGDAFAAVAPEKDPGLDPRPRLPELSGRIILTHGRQDRLIPFTETLRLRSMMPPHVDASATITGLFAHSATAMLHPVAWARETSRFVALLNRALNAV